jgi:hypothetical protein
MTNEYNGDVISVEEIVAMLRKEVILRKKKKKKNPIIILPKQRRQRMNSAGERQSGSSIIISRIKKTVIWKSLEILNTMLRKITLYNRFYIAVRNSIKRI